MIEEQFKERERNKKAIKKAFIWAVVFVVFLLLLIIFSIKNIDYGGENETTPKEIPEEELEEKSESEGVRLKDISSDEDPFGIGISTTTLIIFFIIGYFILKFLGSARRGLFVFV